MRALLLVVLALLVAGCGSAPDRMDVAVGNDSQSAPLDEEGHGALRVGNTTFMISDDVDDVSSWDPSSPPVPPRAGARTSIQVVEETIVAGRDSIIGVRVTLRNVGEEPARAVGADILLDGNGTDESSFASLLRLGPGETDTLSLYTDVGAAGRATTTIDYRIVFENARELRGHIDAKRAWSILRVGEPTWSNASLTGLEVEVRNDGNFRTWPPDLGIVLDGERARVVADAEIEPGATAVLRLDARPGSMIHGLLVERLRPSLAVELAGQTRELSIATPRVEVSNVTPRYACDETWCALASVAFEARSTSATPLLLTLREIVVDGQGGGIPVWPVVAPVGTALAFEEVTPGFPVESGARIEIRLPFVDKDGALVTESVGTFVVPRPADG